MIARIEWSEAAERDVLAYSAYIAQSNRSAAERFLDQVDVTVAFIAGAPGLGQSLLWPHEPALERLRYRHVKGFKNYAVFYRQIEGGIKVIRVVHSARDLGTVFDG